MTRKMSDDAPSGERAVTVVPPAGNRLACEVFEAQAGLAVVFVHGGGQSRHSWRRAARMLQTLGLPCVTFDLRGHGDSDWIADGNYGLDTFQADLEAVVEHWNRPVMLVGASLGGLVSLMLAGSGHPLVRALVMVDTAPMLNVSEIERLVGFLGHGSDGGFASPEAAASHVAAFFPYAAVSAGNVERSMRRNADGRWYWRWDSRVVLGDRNSVAIPHQQMLRRRAQNVQVPFLLVRAEASEIVTGAAIEDLRECAPHLEVVTLPGAHHMITGQDNGPFVEVTRPFIERVSGRCRPRGGSQADGL